MRTSLAVFCLLLLCGVCPAARAAAVPAPAAQQPPYGSPSDRIVGGEDARPHDAPWLVTMQWGVYDINRHLCGGSIIAPNWVLTAGHCLKEVPAHGDLLLFAGRHRLNAYEPATEQRRIVSRRNVWVHERFEGSVNPFDIALLRVEQPFDLQRPAVRSIALPPAGRLHSGLADLHGWGSISGTYDAVEPEVLQTVRVPILPMAECKRVLRGSPPHETNMCTGPLTGGVSACNGDSGGPLTQNGTELVGIVSWGKLPCGVVNGPSVYVRVSAFIEWIEEIRQRNGY